MKRIALLCSLLILFVPTTILADWNDGDPAKWVQLPDPTELGIDVNCSYEYLLADDFLCQETGPITGIHIWGSWLDDFIPFNEDPAAVTFVLSLHRDIPAEQSPTGYSMPGEVLWWRTFERGEFQVRIWSEGVWEGWMDPPEQYIPQADQIIWQYNFEIPETEAFIQEGTPDEPVVYWLDVKAFPADQNTRFGWKTSREHWNDDAVWTFGDEPYSGLWEELRYPPGHEQQGQSIDLSFVIAMPVGPEDRDYGDCPDSYRTLNVTSGPSHPINHPYTLGGRIDGEPDGQPHPQALGDDLNGIDDEDGVDFSLTPLVQGQNATIVVTAGGLSAWLQGWIDFDGDGTFVGPNDQIFLDQWLNIGPNTLNFTVPNSAVAGPTFARFRLCVDMGIGYAGPESYGEVEDYQVLIIAPPPEEDWGDCPEVYKTQGPLGPRHTITTFLTLGPTIDAEPDGQPHPQALRDDFNGIDDEDGVTIPPLVLGQLATLQVEAGLLGGWLQGWIDWNTNGDFADPGEQVFFDQWINTGVNPLSVPVPASAVVGPTFARFRLSNQTGIDHLGWKGYGEVEDYQVVVIEPPPLDDYGDAPRSYGTLNANNGPRHTATVFLTLGPTIDAEPDGQPDPNALGDDNNGIDDEDGMVIPPLIPGQPDTIQVTAGFLGGWLQGWVDFNANGMFDHPAERIVHNFWLNSGANNVPVTLPATAVPGVTFARFRLSQQPDIPPLGWFGYGEVEDYEVLIEDDQPQTYKWIQPPDLTPLGIDVNATMEYLLADDFECSQSGPITEILIWGSWLDDHIPFGEDPRSVNFTLSFHRDIPADQSPTGYSMPGELLWLYHFQAGSFQASIFEGDIEEGWLNPPTDYFFPADWTCWLYRFPVPENEAFIQEGSPQNPVVYWLDLQAEVLDPSAVFGWKTSREHWNDDAVWVQAAEPYFGDWFELRYPPGHEEEGRSIDLAFAFPGEPVNWDFGDAPDDPVNGYYYPTWAAHSGARHLITPNVYMGNSIDRERDGQPDFAAMGDDMDGNDDEDGVVFHNTPLTPGTIDTVTVTVSTQGRLNAWIDFEGDGDWIDPIDQIFVDEPLAAGPNILFFTVPATGMQAHTTYARFRFNTNGGLPFFGTALDGEVEDYLVEIATDPSDAPDDIPPLQFQLHRSVPNPFDESSLIRYDLPDAQFVDLSVFSIDGRKVATLVHDSREAGRHSAIWDGRDEKGQQVAPGIYFYRIEAGPYRHHGRMMMVR